MGYCTVTVSFRFNLFVQFLPLYFSFQKNRPDVDYDDLKVLSEALNRFSEGIPCQSTRLPREVRDIPEIKNRLDEQMMEMCSVGYIIRIKSTRSGENLLL